MCQSCPLQGAAPSCSLLITSHQMGTGAGSLGSLNMMLQKSVYIILVYVPIADIRIAMNSKSGSLGYVLGLVSIVLIGSVSIGCIGSISIVKKLEDFFVGPSLRHDRYRFLPLGDPFAVVRVSHKVMCGRYHDDYE